MELAIHSYLFLSFSYYLLSFISVFHLRHSRDGADSPIFILSLSFFLYSLSLFIRYNYNRIACILYGKIYRNLTISWQIWNWFPFKFEIFLAIIISIYETNMCVFTSLFTYHFVLIKMTIKSRQEKIKIKNALATSI